MLRTQRLILEPWQSSAWADFQPIAEDREVLRYINGGIPWTGEQVRDFVDRQVKMYAQRGFCRWRIVDPASGELMGFCGAGMWRDEPDPEIGWWLARRFWGRGLATEAAHIALRDVFERIGLPRVISVAIAENRASLRVMEKLGLGFQRELQSEGVRLLLHGRERGQQNGTNGRDERNQ